MIALLTTVGVTAASLAFYASKTRYALRGYVVLMMILVTALGGKMVDYFGVTSNVGCVFYAAAIVAQARITLRYGTKVAWSTTLRAITALVVSLLLAAAVSALPVHGDAQFSYAQRIITESMLKLVAPSFFAFLASQFALICVVGAIKTRWSRLATLDAASRSAQALTIIPAVVVAQVVDSFVFFPSAFHELSLSAGMLTLVVNGLLVKTVLTLLFAPIVIFVKESDQ